MGLFDFMKKDKEEVEEKKVVQAPSQAEQKVTTPAFPRTGVVNATNLNIRLGASLERDIITTVPNGVRLTLLDELNGWYKVQLSDGKIGWASGDYIA